MSGDLLEDFEARQEALIRALDGNDVDGIEAAAAGLAAALDRIRGRIRRDDSRLTPNAGALAARAQAAQARVNFLTDGIAHRIERLAAMRGRLPSATYRSGR